MAQGKPYQKPALQAYGDIRAITRIILPGKKLGASDGVYVFQDQSPVPAEDIS